MNLYIRYFDRETLVHNVEDGLDFLRSIPDIVIDPDMENDIRSYMNSDVFYPKRYKIKPRAYFILIKTTANNMTEFKEKKAVRQTPQANNEKREMGQSNMNRLNEHNPGWYEGELNFKRVVMLPSTGKHEYRDTRFVADCKANSGLDCYNRIVEYLKDKVDSRSQFPSAKGKNFHFKYLGMWK